MHALLSDRELSIHSHHPGLLVKLTEGPCNQSVKVKLVHTPIRPMIEKRSVAGTHLDFFLNFLFLDGDSSCLYVFFDDALPLSHTSCQIIN